MHEHEQDDADRGESGGAPDATLVEIEPGLAVALGPAPLDGLDLLPFTLLDDGLRAAMTDAVALSLGGANVAAQVAAGALQVQGLVRLAPETLTALQTMRPMVSGGWNLGTLTSGGKIAAQVRWAPAAGAQAGAFVAAIGPALAMVAIQAQIAEVKKIAARNLELTSKVLQTLEAQHWATVTGLHRTLLTELGHAEHVGSVSEAIYRTVDNQAATVEQVVDLFSGKVRGRVDDVRSRTGHSERRDYLLQHGEAVLADAHGLLLAHASRAIHLTLRAGRLRASAGFEDERLLERLLEVGRASLVEDLAVAAALLDELERELRVVAELDGKRTLPLGGEKRAARDVAEMAARLLEAVDGLRGGRTRSLEDWADPLLEVFEDGMPHELRRVLPLRLQEGERLLAAADVRVKGNVWEREASFAIVTDRRLLVASQGAFRRWGGIAVDVPLADIRYVRTREGSRSGAMRVDVVLKERDLTLSFRDWASDGVPLQQSARVAGLLASFMNLPSREVPTPDVPGLAELVTPPRLHRSSHGRLEQTAAEEDGS